jgi:hypothetical protein
MLKKLLVSIATVLIVSSCAGIGLFEPTTQKNGCPYPKQYSYMDGELTKAIDNYYQWNGMQFLLTDELEGFEWILIDYDDNIVGFGFDDDGTCEANHCVVIIVEDLEQVRTAETIDDIRVIGAQSMNCDMMESFIEENIVE